MYIEHKSTQSVKNFQTQICHIKFASVVESPLAGEKNGAQVRMMSNFVVRNVAEIKITQCKSHELFLSDT